MKTIKINFKEVQPVDLLGQPINFNNLHEQICNSLYRKTASIRVSDVVRKLFYGEDVEVDETALQEIIADAPGAFIAIVYDALINYLTEKLNTLKNENEQKNSN